MKTTRNTCLLLSAMAAGCLAVAHPASAQSQFTVGLYGAGGSADTLVPFGAGNDFAGYEFQQVYEAGAITTAAGSVGPFTIASLGFASDGAYFAQPETVTFTGLTIGLSTTDQGTTNTSTDFATNKGADYTSETFATFTATLKADGSFDLVIPTPSFVYDPNAGNLLLDVTYAGESDSLGGNDTEFFEGDASTATSSVYDQGYGGTPNVAQGTGMITQFTAAPEPSPLAILGIAAVGTVGLIARKRRSATPAA